MEETKFQNDRDRWKYNEATADPIFLFQRKMWVFRDCPNGFVHDEELEGIVIDPDYWDWQYKKFEVAKYYLLYNGKDDESNVKRILTWEELESFECATYYWDTERVFFSREEANEYGHAKSYNYREGWRVYSVTAHGELGEILNMFPGRLKKKKRSFWFRNWR